MVHQDTSAAATVTSRASDERMRGDADAQAEYGHRADDATSAVVALARRGQIRDVQIRSEHVLRDKTASRRQAGTSGTSLAGVEQLNPEFDAVSAATLSAPPSSASGPKNPISTLLRGRIIAEKSYRMCRVIGVGGMGVVYSGEQLATGREVAIKVLRSEHRSNCAAKVRFLREARLLGMLRGSHVPRVLDVGELEDGTLYMVLELLAGPNLRGLLRDRTVSAARAVDLLLQVCEAAAEAHDRGIVHRDIKPENVVLATRDVEVLDGAVVKLVDFGIAKDAESCPPGSAVRYVLGSPEYMAPEQRVAPDTVDPRADVWSLGVLLFELLCGDLPPNVDLGGDRGRLVLMPPMPPGVPEGLEQVIARCLERRPEDRFRDARELGRALLPFASVADGGHARACTRRPSRRQRTLVPQHSGVFRAWQDDACDTLVESGIQRIQSAKARPNRSAQAQVSVGSPN